MRNTLKATTLERKFPLLAVENGCIISKDADITVAFRVELPELFTVTSAEYEAIHSAWYKAIKVLPDYSIVHKQDFFIKESYQPDTERDELSFLSRSFERHFNERPFLNHYCYLFLTKTTRERSRRQSDFSTLCRGRIVPQEIADKEAAAKFIEAVGQFERIMNDSGFVTLTRLAASEITGQDGKAGIIEKYFSLSQTDTTCLKDIGLYPEEMRVGDDILCLHTLSDVEDLPGKVGTDCRFEKLSTDRSDCRLSFAAPVGVLLSCNHVYNQFIFIDDHAENLKNFEQTARNMPVSYTHLDAEQVGADEDYKRMAYEQFTRLGKKAYPVLCSSPEKAIATADGHIAAGHVPDIVFFDLPGTVNSEGVINSLAGMDYIFTPISADKVVLESSLSFAMAIQKLLVRNEACRLAGLYLFWNMVDGREKTDLYTAYDKTIKELELPLMKTFIPDTKRYKKELVADKKAVFRSTLFPASRPLVRGSNLEELITEITYYIKLQ